MDDPRLTRIEAKIDDIAEHLGSIDKTLIEQHESLRYHIKRTTLLENEVRPVKRHVVMVEGAMKLIGLIAMLAAIYEGFKTLIK